MTFCVVEKHAGDTSDLGNSLRKWSVRDLYHRVWSTAALKLDEHVFPHIGVGQQKNKLDIDIMAMGRPPASFAVARVYGIPILSGYFAPFLSWRRPLYEWSLAFFAAF